VWKSASPSRPQDECWRSGFNVYPPEVEVGLSLHPDVGVAAVVGTKVESNEEVVAFLEPKPGRVIDIEGVRAFATARLAPTSGRPGTGCRQHCR
jgi:acyl-CoA synthetase (AMP-forming)/AMP-acid ligase II